jgi:hypothetical protein
LAKKVTGDLLRKIEELDNRLKLIEKAVLRQSSFATPNNMPAFDIGQILNLPDSLRNTIRAMQDLVESDAETVANKTGRTRTVENIYLNELTRLGYLTKARRGKRIFYKLVKYY